jgi:hypothetical protein
LSSGTERRPHASGARGASDGEDQLAEIKPLMASHDISDDHLRALGRIAVAWGFLERSVRTAARGPLNVDPERVEAAGYRIEPILDLLEQAARERLTAADRKELSEILEAIRELKRERNRVIHDYWWAVGDDAAMKQDSRLPLGVKLSDLQEFSAADLERLADRIRKGDGRLSLFLHERGLFLKGST